MSNCLQPYQQLEIDFAHWAAVENVVACNSGTAALHLALEALQLPLGSKVLCPDFTMISCARAIVLAGHTPVFVDCRDDDLNIDPDLIDVACAECGDIRAVMPVAIYGRPCAMNEIIELANKYDLYVVEDLAEAHGLPPHPDSDAAAWSFYANKILTSGEEGGAVAFRSADAAALARQLRCLGFTDAHDFTHVPRGHNYRLANSLAEKILGSLATVDTAILLRRQIESWYNDFCPDQWRMLPRESPWIFDVRIPGLLPSELNWIVMTLRAAGIQARHSFKPMTAQPEFNQCELFQDRRNAYRAAREVFYLPINPGITTRTDCQRAFEIISKTAANLRG